ncbi:MAG TPA: hydantoinase/oxoprolinase family protein, partial [Bordetella sp.]|nr:hydantoinase/oxoprolinase family protein [Bordetella sp.]
FMIPLAAGVGSAVGFLRAPVAYELARSKRQKLSSIDVEDVNAMLGDMSKIARAVVQPAVGNAPLTETRTVSMRYVGQGHELEVDLPARKLSIGDHQVLREAFEQRYETVYGRRVDRAEVEILTWSILVSAPSPGGLLEFDAVETYTAHAATTRSVFDTQVFEEIDYGIFWRDDLKAGAVVNGPAIVEEDETSTVIPVGMQAQILPSGAILCEDIEVKEPSRAAMEAKKEKGHA